jgi:hypothetical protein
VVSNVFVHVRAGEVERETGKCACAVAGAWATRVLLEARCQPPNPYTRNNCTRGISVPRWINRNTETTPYRKPSATVGVGTCHRTRCSMLSREVTKVMKYPRPFWHSGWTESETKQNRVQGSRACCCISGGRVPRNRVSTSESAPPDLSELAASARSWVTLNHCLHRVHTDIDRSPGRRIIGSA